MKPSEQQPRSTPGDGDGTLDERTTSRRSRMLPRRRRALTAIALAAGFVLSAGLGLYVADTASPSSSTSTEPVAGQSPEASFLTGMIAHHEQAVDMAAAAIGISTDSLVRTFAFDILTGQSSQIGMMQSWLTPVDDDTDAPTAGMGPHSMNHTGMDKRTDAAPPVMPNMKGMATAAELTTLTSATGRAFDVMFLQLMLRHHQGGIGMLTDVLDRGDRPLVLGFAESVLALQQHESQVMVALLADRGAAPLPPP